MSVTPVMPRVRRVVARRPWIQWVLVVTLAIGVAASVNDAMAGLEDERSAWGRPVTVWIATADVSVGEPIEAAPTEIPVAVRPAGAVDDPGRSLARREIGRGEIVTTLDLVDDELVPAGWLVAPARESLPSGAVIGEQVQVASDGYVLADEAVVVGFVDDVTLVAAPPDVAVLLSGADGVTLLRAP